MICLECGYLNSPYDERCQNCHAPLPNRETPPPVLSKHYQELESACIKVQNREISSGQFRDTLKRLENIFRQQLDEVEKIEIPSDIKAEMREEMEMGTGGLRLYLEAIRDMYGFLESRDPVCLQRGLALAKDANRRLNTALKINYDNFRSVQSMAEEFLSTQSFI